VRRERAELQANHWEAFHATAAELSAHLSALEGMIGQAPIEERAGLEGILAAMSEAVDDVQISVRQHARQLRRQPLPPRNGQLIDRRG